jgi:hypothetical protein
VAGKAKYQQPTQVDRGNPHRPPQIVAVDPAVGHPPAGVGDQPGDRAFHHRPPAPIAVLEAARGGAAAGGAQLVLVRVDVDRAASLGGGAALAQRATLAVAGEAGLPELVIGAVYPAGHLAVPAWGSIWKSWMVNPPGTALDSGIGLLVWRWPAARRAARVCPDP